MILRALIRKRDTDSHATAISATPAIAQANSLKTVAGIATVAIATPRAELNLLKMPVSDEAANAKAIAGFDRETKLPDSTSEGVLESITSANESLASFDVSAFEKVDSVAVVDLWPPSEQDPELAAYFANPDMDMVPDDRAYCEHCSNLRGRVCAMAKPGGVVSAMAGYRPVSDLLHRCVGFAERSVRAVQTFY